MKTRLATNLINFDGYLLKLLFLFKLAYFYGAGWILNC